MSHRRTSSRPKAQEKIYLYIHIRHYMSEKWKIEEKIEKKIFKVFLYIKMKMSHDMSIKENKKKKKNSLGFLSSLLA